MSLYEVDIVLWAKQQVDALRRRAANEIDWDNVAEEIEDVGRRTEDRIEGALITAIVHLLKWRYQPRARSNAWKGVIVAERDRIDRLVHRNPSLAAWPAKVLAQIYPAARRQAEAETGLTGFADACPWTIEQVLEHAFWPEPPVPPAEPLGAA
jgi:hypothetical protein